MLKFYFDKVHKIDMLHYNIINFDEGSETYKKKYSWTNYSINKWQCLKYVEYDKILFIDVDIIPMIHLLQYKNKHTNKDCVNNKKMYDILNNFNTYKDYIINSKKSNYRLNGGIVLFRPDIEMYNDYIKFVDSINNKGIYMMTVSGIDETTMFYYMVKHREKTFYRICMEYTTIPWPEPALDNYPNENIPIYGANYIQMIKPWKKPLFISWPEEYIWRKLYHKMKKSRTFKQLYKQTIVNGVKEYLNFDDISKKKWYGNNPKITYDITYDNIVKHEEKIKTYGILNKQDIKQILKNIKLYKK